MKRFIIYGSMALVSLGLAITFMVLLGLHDSGNYAVEENPALGIAGGADRYNAMGAVFGLVAGVVVFTLLIAPFILLMFRKPLLAKATFGIAGYLGILFMALAMVMPMRSDSYALLMDIRAGNKDAAITAYIQYNAVTDALENPAMAGLAMISDVLISTPIEDWAELRFDTLAAMAAMGGQTIDLVALHGGIAALAEALQPNIEKYAAAAIEQAKSEANSEYRTTMLKLIAHLVVFGVMPLGAGIVLRRKMNEKVS